MLLAEAMTTRACVRSRTLSPVVDFFVTVAQIPWARRPYPVSFELLETLRRDEPVSTGDVLDRCAVPSAVDHAVETVS